MAVRAHLAASCGFCLERGSSLLPPMLATSLFLIPLNPDPKSGVPLGQVPLRTSPFHCLSTASAAPRLTLQVAVWRWEDGPWSFPEGPQRPRRLEQGPSTWSIFPDPLLLYGCRARQPCHTHSPKTHTSNIPLPELFTCLSPGLLQSAQPRCRAGKGKGKKNQEGPLNLNTTEDCQT